MGVHSLWELLAPVGRRVSVEALGNKKLAVDASIWIIQFMKAMRDERGDMIRNAHLLGFIRRICKLLFLRVKPIFVFDGATPPLKRRTVIARRRQRENAQAKIRKTAEKLLLSHLRTRELEEIVNGSREVPVISVQGEAEHGNQELGNAQQQLLGDPAANDHLLAASLAFESEEDLDGVARVSGDVSSEEEDEDVEELPMLPTVNGQVDPAVLASLPPSMQLDLLVQMREQLVTENRQRFQRVANAPSSFSELQIQAYLKTVAFRREINNVQQAAAGRGVGGVPSTQIASEGSREFIFSSAFVGGTNIPETRGKLDVQEGRLPAPDTLKVSISPAVPSREVCGFRDEAGNSDWDVPMEYLDHAAAADDEIQDDPDGDAEIGTPTMHECDPDPEEEHFDPSKASGVQLLHHWVDDHDTVERSQASEGVECGNVSSSLTGLLSISFDYGGPALEKGDDLFRDLVSKYALGQGQEFTSSDRGTDEASAREMISKLKVENDGEECSDGDEIEWEEDVAEGADATDVEMTSIQQMAMTKGLLDSAVDDHQLMAQTQDYDQEGRIPSSGAHHLRTTFHQEEEVVPDNQIVKSHVVSEQPNEGPVHGADRTDVGDGECLAQSDFRDSQHHPVSDRRDEAAALDADRTDVGDAQFVAQSDSRDSEPRLVSERRNEAAVQNAHRKEVGVVQGVTESDFTAGKPLEENEHVHLNREHAQVAADVNREAVQAELESLAREQAEMRSSLQMNERNAELVTGEMFAECQELLQMFGLPYLIAPMEAEAQCAYMDATGLVDGVVTDDSDVFLFGGRNVYKNIFDDRKYVETYHMKDIETELGLSREKLIHMALLLGSDYTEGVSGIGIVNAIEVVNAFPGEDGLQLFKQWLDSPDLSLLRNVSRKSTNRSTKQDGQALEDVCGPEQAGSGQGRVSEVKDIASNSDNSIENNAGSDLAALQQTFMATHRTVSKNWKVPDSFPSEAVVDAYINPRVDESQEALSWGRPDIDALRKLCSQSFGWNSTKTDELLLPVLKEYDRREIQLRLDSFYSFNQRFAKIRSTRIQKAVSSITGRRSNEIMDSPPKSRVTRRRTSKGVEGSTSDMQVTAEQQVRQRNSGTGALAMRGQSSRGRGRKRGRAVSAVTSNSEANNEDSQVVGLKKTTSSERPGPPRRSLRSLARVVEKLDKSDEGIGFVNDEDQHLHRAEEEATICAELLRHASSLDSPTRLYGGGFCVSDDSNCGDTDNHVDSFRNFAPSQEAMMSYNATTEAAGTGSLLDTRVVSGEDEIVEGPAGTSNFGGSTGFQCSQKLDKDADNAGLPALSDTGFCAPRDPGLKPVAFLRKKKRISS